MPCGDLPRVKAAIRSVTCAQARALAETTLELPSMEAIEEHLRAHLDPLRPASVLASRNAA